MVSSIRVFATRRRRYKAMAQQGEVLAGTRALGEEEVRVRRRSNLWRDAASRFFQNKLGMIGLVMVTFLVLVAIFGPLVAPKERDKIYFGHQQESPSSEFLLGTDFESRDLFTRLIYGARVALIVGLGTQVIILLIGVTVGALAGFFGGTVDTIL